MALLLALAATPARAAPELLVAPVVVNEEPRGEAFFIRDGDDILMREPDLAALGVQTNQLWGSVVHVHMAQREGEAYVSLASLAPSLRFAFDPDRVILELQVRSAMLGRTVYDLAARGNASRPSRDQAPAIFVNYAVQGFDLARDETRAFVASGEAALSADGMLAYTSATRQPDSTIVRGLSSLSFDVPEHLARLQFGDSLASTTPLGGSAFVGGVQYARQFELDPWLQRTPMPSISGAAETPSTLEVYVDDVLVRRESIAPGTFEVRNLPVMAGTGETRYVVRDAFGREREVIGSYTVGSALLLPGLSDFSYTLGARRENLQVDSLGYGAPVFLGAHRLGLTDWLTGGLRLEAAPDVVSGGTAFVTRLPVGIFSLEGGASHTPVGDGAAGIAAWAYSGRRLGLSLWARAMSPRYANASLEPTRERALLDTGGGISVPLGAIGGANAGVAHRVMRDGGVQERQTLGTTWRLASGVSLGLTGTRTSTAGQATLEAWASLLVVLPRGGSAQAWASGSRERTASGFTFQERPREDIGWEYRAGVTQAETDSFELRGGYRGMRGQAFADVGSASGRTAVGAEVAGSVVGIGGRLFLARPIDRSFALVRMPGAPDATVRLNNREVGQTDASGDLLVVGLQSYDANQLSVDAEDLPFDLTFGSLQAVVAPPRRGGAIAHIEARRIRAVRGVLVRKRDGASVALAYGDLDVETPQGRATYPLGSRGQFEVDLPAGTFDARVVHDAFRCTATLTIPDTPEPIVDLGTMDCTAEHAL